MRFARASYSLVNEFQGISFYIFRNDFTQSVGNGAITYLVSDIMVEIDYQRKEFTKQIMQTNDNYFAMNADGDSCICLIENHLADSFLQKHRFEYLP